MTPVMTDNLSAVAFRIDAFFEATLLSCATAFLYRRSDLVFLITNRHVVTGRHQQTNQPLHDQGGLPDRIRGSLPRRLEASSSEFTHFEYASFEMCLYDDSGLPMWLEHPSYRERADIAAIRIGEDKARTLWTINDAMSRDQRFARHFDLHPGYDGFILGFPLGLRIGGHLPLWKRCTIASEPEFDVNDLPQILVDTATRSGMSGSPVIAQISGAFPSEGLIFAIKRRFIGVYSGRLGQDEFQAQLGIVWKESSMIELVTDGIGEQPTNRRKTSPRLPNG